VGSRVSGLGPGRASRAGGGTASVEEKHPLLATYAGAEKRIVMSWRRHAALLLVVGALAGCRTGRNYESPAGPRYAGGPRVGNAAKPADAATLRIVSFNIEFGEHVDSAIGLLTSDPALRAADVILLQEMDGEGTERVAAALGLWYVYFPAIYHLRIRREFGNAVLSRWPIVEDGKILLPHTARFSRTRRTATAATLRVGESLVRVYSTHLSTMTDVAPAGRRDQLRTILSDAARYPVSSSVAT
jgi:endonuclease/exonuclease/phosphatase (EEP) superfamily protein YafD